MKKQITILLLLFSPLATAQVQSFICKGEEIASILYSAGINNSAHIGPAESSKNSQTWVFNEDGLFMLGGADPLMPISICEQNDEGKPHCTTGTSSFTVLGNNIFELNIATSVDPNSTLAVKRTVVVGRCSKI